MEKLRIAIMAGTTRPKRRSIKAAQYVYEVGKKLNEIEVEFVDPVEFNFPGDGNDEENKDPRYTEIVKKSDGFFIVTPEYNHSYPGSLKRMLDSELKFYIHKPVALAGVSSGRLGGARAIEALIPVVRELGLVAIFTDVLFPNVSELFDEDENIKDEKYEDRVKRAYEELIWMAKTLKWGRENLNK